MQSSSQAIRSMLLREGMLACEVDDRQLGAS